jgi:hypothetical protein
VTYSRDNLHAYTWDLARYVARTNRIHRQCYNGRRSTTGVIFDLFLLALFIHIMYMSWIYASLAQLFWGAQDKGKKVWDMYPFWISIGHSHLDLGSRSPRLIA